MQLFVVFYQIFRFTALLDYYESSSEDLSSEIKGSSSLINSFGSSSSGLVSPFNKDNTVCLPPFFAKSVVGSMLAFLLPKAFLNGLGIFFENHYKFF